MTSRALAWRTVAASPARALLAVAGVAVIGALLFDMLLLSHGLLISFRDLLDSAGYDVRVIASDDPPAARIPITHADALIADISRLPEVQEIAAVRWDRALAIVSGRPAEGVTLISATEGAERKAWRIINGENLVAAGGTREPPPLVVSMRFAEALGLKVGSALGMRTTMFGAASAIPPVMFRVVGVAEFDFEPPGDLMAATTIDAFRRVHAGRGQDNADVVVIASRPPFGPDDAVTAINHLRPDLHAYSNAQLVTHFDQNGFAYFRQISFVLSSVTLGFAFLLIATLLTMSVNQRLSEMAALRALGFPRRRIVATLLWESTMLVGVGGLLALPLGGLLALELDRILRAMPGIPERLHFFVLEPRAVVLHIGLLAATGLGAAAYPIWVAARLPIAATLRRETVS